MLIAFLKTIGKIPWIPFPFKLFLFRMDRRFSHILPVGRSFIFEKYLSDVKVKINTIYPIEKAMLTGEYDQVTSMVLRKFLNSTSVVIDVGANSRLPGGRTLLLGRSGRPYCQNRCPWHR